MLRPIVKWAQSNTQLFIKIEMLPVDNTTITLLNNTLEFKNTTHYFCINFCDDVDNDIIVSKSYYYQLTINKKERKYWEYLCIDNKNKDWIKIDWDKWKDEDQLRDVILPVIDTDFSDEESDISVHSSESEDDTENGNQ